jgi:dihydrofolate synthase/folylpolyglutamate synthase
LPALAGEHQVRNAAAALMALIALADTLPVSGAAIRRGLRMARLPGRFQVFSGPVSWILDVAHNAHAGAALARCLQRYPCTGRTHLVWGMLAGKDAAAMARALEEVVDCWYPSSLDGPRGQTGEMLARTLAAVQASGSVTVCADVEEACRNAARLAHTGDRIVATGSFHTVARVFSLAPTPLPEGRVEIGAAWESSELL